VDAHTKAPWLQQARLESRQPGGNSLTAMENRKNASHLWNVMAADLSGSAPTCATIKDASIYYALSPWTALYRDYVRKLKSVDMFVLLRQEYECDLSAAPLEETPGVKYAHFNLSSLLRPEPLPGHRFDDEKELLELWRTEYEWRMSQLDEEDSAAGAQTEQREMLELWRAEYGWQMSQLDSEISTEVAARDRRRNLRDLLW
jgi:hypothetical protein